MVGNEGAAGVPIVAGLTRSTVREIVQITTDGFKVKAGAILNILKSMPQLQMVLTRYAIVQGYIARLDTYRVTPEVNPETGEIIHLCVIEMLPPEKP